MSRGCFITFEGLDGSGKSTQIKKLARSLEAAGERFVLTRQPGGTAIGDRIRSLLLDSRAEDPSPYAELAMMFADRAQSIQQVILPALVGGSTVICDRYTDSTEAYQGGGRRLGSELVHTLHRTLCGDLQPDLTLLLMPPFELSLERARRRNQRVLENTGKDENRFETLDVDFFRRAYDVYRTIAERDKLRVIVIESEAGVEVIASSILGIVRERLTLFRQTIQG
jgi:dTMP kinase